MNYNVLHIQTIANSEGCTPLRIHRALLEQGVNSMMLVVQGSGDAIYQATQSSTLNRYVPPKNRLIRKIKNKLRNKWGKGLLLSEKLDYKIWDLAKLHPMVCYSQSYSQYDLAEHPLVKEADIVHLHWVQNFLDFESFFKKMKELGKPIVWTFHDLNPMMGGFHHIRLREKYYNEYQMVEDAQYEMKRCAVSGDMNLNIVAISSQMKDYIFKHEFYKDRSIYNVFNCVDEKKFFPVNKKDARSVLSIDENQKVLLFVSSYLNDSEKGMNELIQALELLNLNDILLICVGDGEIPQTNVEVQRFSSVHDTIWLSTLYSVADLMVIPSFQESFGNTCVEAMLCGTPVVMTPVGIAMDVIDEKNGVVCQDYTVEALAQGIKIAMDRQYDGSYIRQKAIDSFNPNKIANEYIGVYEDVLKKEKHEV
jgi:glycosyltransferase involved in cell wall biosynthesis